MAAATPGGGGEGVRSPARPPFDPRRGCQELSTGVLGGGFIILLMTAYGDFRMTLPPDLIIEHAFPWLPDWLQYPATKREAFLLLGVLALGLLLMASWELLRRRGERLLLSLGAALIVGAAWHTTLTSSQDPWITVGGWHLLRMELVLLAGGLAIAALDLVLGLSQRPTRPITHLGGAVRSAFWRWLAGLAAFWLVLVTTYRHPFYGTSFYETWRFTIDVLFSIYLFLGLPYAFLTNLERGTARQNLADPGFVLLLIARGLRHRRLRRVLGCRRVRITLRDLLVKVFYIPVMTCIFFFNTGSFFGNFLYQATGVTAAGVQYTFHLENWYGFAFHGLGLMDVSLSLLGYLCASRWLGNKSVSVEPTVGGWLVALACYPPLNDVTTSLLPINHDFGGPHWLDFAGLDVVLKIVSLTMMVIYVFSTMAFGLRFSNLTHRGIVTRGPYAAVRHPAYITKLVSWWAENVRSFTSIWQFVFLAGWTGIYVLRALTEERHLLAFDDYRAYARRVRWRFIPRVL